MNISFPLIEPEECNDQCTKEEDLVCGDNEVTYHNECLLKHGACVNGRKIEVDRKGPCPLMDNNEEEKNKQADAFDTEGDDDDYDNSNENDEILRDGEGKDIISILNANKSLFLK